MRTSAINWVVALIVGLCLGTMLAVAAFGDTNDGVVSIELKHGDAALDLTKGKEIPPEIAERLTADQLYELMQMKMEKSADIPVVAPLIVAIVFGCPVLIVAAVLYFRQRRHAMMHRTLAAMIEKGTPIPPELLTPEPRRRPSDLRRGIVLLMTGFGVIGFFLAQKEEGWGLGLIPLLIGVGYLIVWKLDQRKQAS
jgi:hypothetical protein